MIARPDPKKSWHFLANANFDLGVLITFGFALLLGFADKGVAASYPADELLKYDAKARDTAQKVYERQHRGLVPQNDVSTETQASNLKKFQDGKMAVEAYLKLRALYETDVRNLDLRRPPEVIREKITIPLDDTYVKRLDFPPPLYKEQQSRGPCCNWYRHQRTRVFTYQAILDADQYTYDFVIFVVDTNGLDKYAYQQLKKILQFIEGGTLVDQAKGIGKAIVKGIDVGKEIQDGKLGKATIKTTETAAIKILKDRLKKMKGGADKLVGPLTALYKDIKQLKRQGEGMINAFEGKNGMTPGKVVYLGNFIDGERLKGTRLLPDDVWWKASDSAVETSPDGTFFAELPCGMSQSNVGRIGGGSGFLTTADLCGKKQAAVGGSHRKEKKKIKKKSTGSYQGIEPHKVSAIPVTGAIEGVKRTTIKFADKCKQKAHDSGFLRCKKLGKGWSDKRNAIYEKALLLNTNLETYKSARMDYEQALRKYGKEESRTVRGLKQTMLNIRGVWQTEFKSYEKLKAEKQELDGQYRRCKVEAIRKAVRSPPCPKDNSTGDGKRVITGRGVPQDTTTGGTGGKKKEPGEVSAEAIQFVRSKNTQKIITENDYLPVNELVDLSGCWIPWGSSIGDKISITQYGRRVVATVKFESEYEDDPNFTTIFTGTFNPPDMELVSTDIWKHKSWFTYGVTTDDAEITLLSKAKTKALIRMKAWVAPSAISDWGYGVKNSHDISINLYLGGHVLNSTLFPTVDSHYKTVLKKSSTDVLGFDEILPPPGRAPLDWVESKLYERAKKYNDAEVYVGPWDFNMSVWEKEPELSEYNLDNITVIDENSQLIEKLETGDRFWIKATSKYGCPGIRDHFEVNISPTGNPGLVTRVMLAETGPDSLEFHSPAEGVLVADVFKKKEDRSSKPSAGKEVKPGNPAAAGKNDTEKVGEKDGKKVTSGQGRQQEVINMGAPGGRKKAGLRVLPKKSKAQLMAEKQWLEQELKDRTHTLNNLDRAKALYIRQYSRRDDSRLERVETTRSPALTGRQGFTLQKEDKLLFMSKARAHLGSEISGMKSELERLRVLLPED